MSESSSRFAMSNHKGTDMRAHVFPAARRSTPLESSSAMVPPGLMRLGFFFNGTI